MKEPGNVAAAIVCVGLCAVLVYGQTHGDPISNHPWMVFGAVLAFLSV